MSVLDEVLRLLEETPKYMTHVTVSRFVLERLIEEIKDLRRRVPESENPK